MDQSAGALVRAAAEGSQDAWNALVDRYNGLVWSVARAFGLGTADAADVTQTAWLRLVERLATIRDPDRVGAWLVTTTRNECRQLLRSGGRVVPTGDEFDLEPRDNPTKPVDSDLLDAERDHLLWRSVDQLPEHCRRLLRVLMADPAPSYQEAGAALDMPVGSIGPTRARCLVRLRGIIEAEGIGDEYGDAV